MFLPLLWVMHLDLRQDSILQPVQTSPRISTKPYFVDTTSYVSRSRLASLVRRVSFSRMCMFSMLPFAHVSLYARVLVVDAASSMPEADELILTVTVAEYYKCDWQPRLIHIGTDSSIIPYFQIKSFADMNCELVFELRIVQALICQQLTPDRLRPNGCPSPLVGFGLLLPLQASSAQSSEIG